MVVTKYILMFLGAVQFLFCAHNSFAQTITPAEILLDKLKRGEYTAVNDRRDELIETLGKTNDVHDRIELLEIILIYDAESDDINALDRHVVMLREQGNAINDQSSLVVADIFQIYSDYFKNSSNSPSIEQLNSLSARRASLNDTNLDILYHNALSIILAFNGSYAAALNEINLSLLLEPEGRYGEVLELFTFWTLSYLHVELINDVVAVEYYTRAFDFAVERDLPVDVNVTTYNVGIVLNEVFKPAIAQKYFNFYQQLAQRAGDEAWVMDAYYSMANIESQLGNYEKSEEYIAMLGDFLPKGSWHHINVTQSSALNLASLGKLEEAQQKIDEVYAYLAINPDRNDIKQIRGLKSAEAEMLRQKGDIDKANEMTAQNQAALEQALTQNISFEITNGLRQVDEGIRDRDNRVAMRLAEAEQNRLIMMVSMAFVLVIFVAAFLQIRANKKLRLANHKIELESQHKSDFLANMSHELRTPLNAVIGYSDMLMLERSDKLSKEKKNEYLNDIKDSGIHLLNLINDILDLSKIEAGKLELNEEPVDLTLLLEEIHIMLWPGLSKKEQECKINIDDDLPKLLADRKLIKQILINLITNSSRYSDHNSKINIGAHLTDSHQIKIEVKDDGYGMDEDHLEIAMKPFMQSQTSYVRSENSTGLGLPIVIELSNLHEAEFDIKSEPDVGTSVVITFPASRTVN